MAVCGLALAPCEAKAEGNIVNYMNAANVILPSSQYSPDSPYECQTWVFNGGAYVADNYNKILGTPADDADGHKWYDPEYQLTVDEGNSIAWQLKPSPYYDDDNGAVQSAGYGWTAPGFTADFYGRRTFTLNEELPLENIILACGHDDAPCEYYINGVLVVAVNDGWENGMWRVLSDEHKALIKTDGTENVLAFHVHQNWGGAFADCGLYGADMSRATTLLNTVADGKWPCKAYMLNYNSDIPVAEAAGWAAGTEDESDWMETFGPMSNDANMFLITQWPSQVRPILIRRHFTFTADDMASLADAELKLTCSYDENPKIYLNGTLIWSTTGWNDNNYASYTLTEAQRGLLYEGDNVLAVSLSQGEGGGHIDYGLQIVAPYDNSGIISPEAEVNVVREADNRVFNLHGQYLGTSTDRLPRGIYVVGGKKTVIK